MSVKQNLFLSVFIHECLMMFNDVLYTTFKLFVRQMSNYLFVISFKLMLYKTLRYRLARALLEYKLNLKAKVRDFVANLLLETKIFELLLGFGNSSELT